MRGFQIIINQQVEFESFFNRNEFDNYFLDDNDVIIAIEGVVLNSDQFPQDEKRYHLLYKQYGEKLSAQLEGEFVGFIYDRKKQYVYSFTNYTATRKLFYYHYNNNIIIDTSLSRLTNYLKSNRIGFSLDIITMYQLLTTGNTLEDYTPIKEVKKLCDAEQLNINLKNNQLKISSYNQVLSDFKGKKEDAIQEINHLFTEAIHLEFGKDKTLNKDTFSFLSGGLDSRMTALVALKEGYSIDEAFCFSQKGYWDELIAKKIAEDYNIPFHFIPLNDGKYLNQIDEIFKISEGLGIYSGCLHTNYAYQFIDKNRFGLIHSGQLGDGILGGFNRSPFRRKPTKDKIVVHQRLFSRIEEHFNAITERYDREEIFLTRNVGYNRTVLGSYLAEEFSYQVSPFMYSKFIQFAQSLPEEWKYNQAIYIDWINAFHKDSTKYRWERTLLKPTSNLNTIIGEKIIKRAYNIGVNRILKLEDKGKMTAYSFYYDRDSELKKQMDSYFKTWIDLTPDNSLKEDLISQYTLGDFIEKTAVLTVLSNVKHYFN